MTDNTSGESHQNYWSGFESNQHLFRFMAATLAILLPFVVLIYVGVSSLGFEVGGAKVQIGLKGTPTVNDSISRIEFGQGGLELKTEKGDTFASTLVPANRLWVPTGIQVHDGDCIQIQASGSVDLAMNQTLDIAKDPSRFSADTQYYFLVDPRGNRLDSGLSGERVRRRAADDLRDGLKLARGVPLGALVATVADRSTKVRLDENPTDAKIFSILDSKDGYSYRGAAGDLLLSVNDLVPNRTQVGRETWLLKRNVNGRLVSDSDWYANIQTAYSIAASEVPRKIVELEHRWDSAPEQNQRYLFEDNSGYFMAAVAIVRSSDGQCS